MITWKLVSRELECSKRVVNGYEKKIRNSFKQIFQSIMGIFDFLKKKKDKLESTKTVDSESKEVDPNINDDGEPKPDMFDILSRKSFYRNEAAYRHQQIVIPRFKAETGIPLKSVLEHIMPDVVSKVKNMTELHTVQISKVETNSQHFNNAEDALAYDLLWKFNYKNDEGEILPLTGTNITLIIRTKGDNVPSYMILFVRGMARGFEEIYIRITLMFPRNDEKDDLRTSKSNSVPVMTSFLIACDLKDNPQQFNEYEEAEARVMDCAKNGERLRDDIDAELYFGLGEFRPTSYYVGYGKYLFEQKRYYDAYVTFMRAISGMKHQQEENSKEFYEVCKYTARCLMEHNHYEKAGYYYSLAYSGGAVSEDENENFWIAIADIRSIDYICDVISKEHGVDIGTWPKEAQTKYSSVYYYYQKNCEDDKKRSENISFYSNTLFSFILSRLLNIEYNTIGGMSIISPDGSVSSVTDKDQIGNEGLYKYMIPGTTLVLPYSRAHYAIGETEDLSVLCHASSIIIRIDSADADKDLVRVNIMIPNFNNNDDKHDFSRTNDPISISFIMSSKDEPKLSGEKNLEVIYDYANVCMSQNRLFEAQIALLIIYKKLSVIRLSMSDKELELFYRTAYGLGFCFEELQNHEVALFYLEIASKSGIDTHVQEYINALVNNRDPRALEVIRKAKETEYDADPESEGYKFHFAFLNRREAYVLIDQKKYDEAEVLLKEMLNDPSCKDFAEGELSYIKQLRKQ